MELQGEKRLYYSIVPVIRTCPIMITLRIITSIALVLAMPLVSGEFTNTPI